MISTQSAGEVRIESAVAGAAVLAAGTAEISGDVAGDVLLAGGQINLDGGVGDDLRAAGGDVQITGFVTDQATIAGANVTIGPDSAIGGRTWIAAGNVEMAGQIGDDLQVLAGTAVISGRVAGNVGVAAREIRVGAGCGHWRRSPLAEQPDTGHRRGRADSGRGRAPPGWGW